jgi:hypothetical protein
VPGGWGGVLNQSLHARARSSHISALTLARTLTSMSSWKPSRSSMQSACRPTGPYMPGSATCSSARSGDLRTRWVGSVPISTIKREAGPSRAGCQSIEWHPDELYPHIGFIVTNYNASRLAERVVASTVLAVLAGHRCESPI